MKPVEQLKKDLSKRHRKEYAYLTGIATAGIYLILRALGYLNKRVAIPNNVCFNVPLAVLFSGNGLFYADITKANLGLDPKHLMANEGAFDVVIAAHTYGSICDIEAIQSYCIQKDLFLIEDLAPAQGGRIAEKPVGFFGNCSVVSFGAGKIIDAGHGGAVLSDDRSLINEIERIDKTLPTFSTESAEQAERLSKYHTALYNEHYGKDLDRFAAQFVKHVFETKDHLLLRFNQQYAEVILEKLCELDSNNRRRREKARKLTELLEENGNDGFEVYTPPDGSVYWRFNLFLKNHRDEVFRQILRKGYKISSWFPSVDMFFEERKRSSVVTPVSDEVGDQILNLWVNDEVDNTYLRSVSEEIVGFFKNRDHGNR